MGTATPQIKVAGSEISEASYDELVECRVRAAAGTAAHARIRFHDAASIGSTFPVGDDLEISVVDADATATVVFTGTILSVGIDFGGGRRDLNVEAYDHAVKLGQSVVYESHLNKSPSDVITAIAGAANLSATIDPALNTVQDHIQQAATPQAFLDQLTHVFGCEWYVEGTELVVERRKLRGTKVTLDGEEDLREFSARFTSVEQAEAVEVRGWNPVTRDPVTSTVTSSGSTTNHDVAAISTARGNATVNTAIAWPAITSIAEHADEIAEGLNARMEAATVTGRGVTEVNPKIKPGCTVEIVNVVPDWNGDYYVNDVEHVFGENLSYLTRFRIGGTTPNSLVDLFGNQSSMRADSPSRLASGVTVGTVTQLGGADDSKAAGRVKVHLPYLGENHETDWTRVVQLGAGDGRGLNMLPEVDDEVLVAFEHGEIGEAVVLGGLYNGVATAENPNAVRNGQVAERSLVTRTDHALRFAEGDQPEDQHITIEHGEGTATLILGKEKLELIAVGVPVEVSTDDAKILMDAGTLTLQANEIVIDASQKLELKANQVSATSETATEISAGSTLKLDGSASSELSGGGSTTIKGGMVKIN